ncbi:MAG: polysaccharide biosynthesis/export family protein [Gemmatimonadota bacterium]
MLAMTPELTLTTGIGRLPLRVFLLAAVCLLGTSAVEAQAGVTAGSQVSSYRVRTGDLLRLRIWMGQNDAPISADIPVEETGQVHLPRVGAVQVAGKTVEELRQTLRDSYKGEYSNAVVTITPIFPVSVLGAVEQPGAIEAVPGMTLFDAITAAGGFRDNAKVDAIKLLRAGQVTTIDGTGPQAMNEVQLQSGDRVVVDAKSRLTLQVVTAALQAASFLATIYVALR